MADNKCTQQLFDLWKKQVNEGTQDWLKMAGQGQPVDPQAFWRPFMDQGMQAWSKVMTQGTVSPDLMTPWKQFLDQWIAAWSKVLEQSMGTENFAQAMGKQLEGFLSVAAPVKKAADQQIEAGHSRWSALRKLGYKWLRIFFHCWALQTPYDEATHQAFLIKHGSRLAARLAA